MAPWEVDRAFGQLGAVEADRAAGELDAAGATAIDGNAVKSEFKPYHDKTAPLTAGPEN